MIFLQNIEFIFVTCNIIKLRYLASVKYWLLGQNLYIRGILDGKKSSIEQGAGGGYYER